MMQPALCCVCTSSSSTVRRVRIQNSVVGHAVCDPPWRCHSEARRVRRASSPRTLRGKRPRRCRSLRSRRSPPTAPCSSPRASRSAYLWWRPTCCSGGWCLARTWVGPRPTGLGSRARPPSSPLDASSRRRAGGRGSRACSG